MNKDQLLEFLDNQKVPYAWRSTNKEMELYDRLNAIIDEAIFLVERYPEISKLKDFLESKIPQENDEDYHFFKNSIEDIMEQINKPIHKYKGGALKDPIRKKIFAKKHKLSGAIISWPTTPTRTRPSQRNQEGTPDSSSCVAQGVASHAELWLGDIMSAQPIFFNRAGGHGSYGMSLSDADNISLNIGTNTEALIPSQRMSDAQLDTPVSTPTPYRALGKGIFVRQSMDDIADAITQYKGVKLTFASNGDEWDEPNQTPVYKGSPIEFRHQIFAFDFFINNGVRTLVCNDSDGIWSSSNGLRYITEDFLKKRCTGASTVPGWGIHHIVQTPVGTQIDDTTTVSNWNWIFSWWNKFKQKFTIKE